jgi:hypothetical protein
MKMPILITTIVMIVSTMSMNAQTKPLVIQFLGMQKGCPHTPKLRDSLTTALSMLGWDTKVESLDVFELSRRGDPRAGYGSPTVLVNGRDLLGAEPSSSLEPACRYYPGGLPTVVGIVSRLQELSK